MEKRKPEIRMPVRRLLFRSLVLWATTAGAQNAFQPGLDVTQFQDNDQKSYLDISYSISRAAINYQPAATGGYACRLVMMLRVYRESALWASKAWKVEETIADSTRLRSANQLVDMVRYQIEQAGRYRIVLQMQDLQRSPVADSASVEIEVRDFQPERVEMSDLQLASSITPAVAGKPMLFTRQVYEVIPSVTALFGEGAPDLYYYFEAYHLLKNISSKKYKTIYAVENLAEPMVEKMNSSHLKSKRYDSIAEVGKLSVARLPTGSYRLVCSIADSAENVLASRDRKFFVYNPSVSAMTNGAGAADGTVVVGPLQALTEKELDEEFERMIYLTTGKDREMFKSLKGAEAKRRFVSTIWQSPRDGDALSGLAYREQYLSRVRQAELRFKSPARSGWKSDRGRVYILYGPADRLDRFPSTTTSLPYETWTYDHLKNQGGVMFVFADRSGFNYYEQVHSTLQGELQDENWQQLITRSTNAENAAY